MVYFSQVSPKRTKLLQFSFHGQRPQGKQCSGARFVYLLSRLYTNQISGKTGPFFSKILPMSTFQSFCLNLNNPLINDKHKQNQLPLDDVDTFANVAFSSKDNYNTFFIHGTSEFIIHTWHQSGMLTDREFLLYQSMDLFYDFASSPTLRFHAIIHKNELPLLR